jgi:hypothetical protein
MARARAFVYTLSNYSEKDFERLCAIESVYKIVGREVAPTTGTKHLQCYFYFKSARNFAAVKEQLGCGHIEKAKGTAVQNRMYCSKEGNFYESGKVPKQGEGTDIQEAVAVLRKRGYRAVAEECPDVFLKYYRGAVGASPTGKCNGEGT